MGEALYLMQKAAAKLSLHHLSGSDLEKKNGEPFSRAAEPG